MSFLFVFQRPELAEFAPLWRIAEGVMLFAIVSLLGFIANRFVKMGPMVQDHEIAIYGREGVNGLKRSHADHEFRIGKIEDRNIGIDAVAKAELEQYKGEERRHEAMRRLADIIRKEIEEERKQ